MMKSLNKIILKDIIENCHSKVGTKALKMMVSSDLIIMTLPTSMREPFGNYLIEKTSFMHAFNIEIISVYISINDNSKKNNYINLVYAANICQ